MIKALIAGIIAMTPCFAAATIVQFQTSLGEIEVNLFDEETPVTVKNFLAYVKNDDYDNAIFHRLVRGFIIQGGGFNIGDEKLGNVPINSTVINEPKFSNVKGTIAMAKVGGDPNSATNQWFFNLANNASILDDQNGGFTTFGQVIGGADVLEALGALETFSFGDLKEIPLRDWKNSNPSLPTEENYLIISNIAILDAAPDTAKDLSPALTTRTSSESTDNGGSGGATSALFIFFLTGLFATLKLRNRRQGQR